MPTIRECKESKCYWCEEDATWEVVLFAWEDPIHHPFCSGCWKSAKGMLTWRSNE